MAHTYSYDRTAIWTFYTDHSVSVLLHVEQALFATGAFNRYGPFFFFGNTHLRLSLLINCHSLSKFWIEVYVNNRSDIIVYVEVGRRDLYCFKQLTDGTCQSLPGLSCA